MGNTKGNSMQCYIPMSGVQVQPGLLSEENNRMEKGEWCTGHPGVTAAQRDLIPEQYLQRYCHSKEDRKPVSLLFSKEQMSGQRQRL